MKRAKGLCFSPLRSPPLHSGTKPAQSLLLLELRLELVPALLGARSTCTAPWLRQRARQQRGMTLLAQDHTWRDVFACWWHCLPLQQVGQRQGLHLLPQGLLLLSSVCLLLACSCTAHCIKACVISETGDSWQEGQPERT